jgi:hypothetical protein
MNNTMQNLDYIEFCEELYHDWKNQKLERDNVLTELFQLDYSPEPYFELNQGDNPLYVLLTNPGSGMVSQKYENHNCVCYKELQINLKEIYTSESFRQNRGSAPAFRRLMKSIDFANYLKYNAVINIETIPFHSETLSKPKALKAIRKSSTLFTYQNALKIYLKDKPVLIVSACNSKVSISIKSILESEWLTYQCNLANIPINDLNIKPLTSKKNKVTSALFYNKNKYIVLMMGSNNLPNVK